MPWHVEQGGGTCAAGEWAVIKNSDGSTEGCHPSKAKAEAQMAALYANEPAANGRAGLYERAAEARAKASRSGGFPQFPAGIALRNDKDAPRGRAAATFSQHPDHRDGKDWIVIEGYASVFEQPYEMWDVFGPYSETVGTGSADKTLAAGPLVHWRFNHGEMTMARTDNGRLELWAEDGGLGDRAWVNPTRSDVKDLVIGIDDRDITEQSFMFRITDGVWNDDFTEYRINEFDLDRGDVGPVTYGANPHTSVHLAAHRSRVATRSGLILADLADLPPLAANEALSILRGRADLEREGRDPVLELALLRLDES